eukprot:CAMPEP_0201229162 /NCGR_PEP_ID=MMETSP0852-20130820/747_1 /ASSEMBLY_ACC=CAM_ASM_000632 /TAXON_ID=183588 /ORGANISM="Pseudo-nitzschia fraudulenta, Strain WWA7" /LENGTH=75 /DNA_ID=CAMNT_0047519381 /DNA_START=261 /DNA_END=485 /DNA_ORIENTATION=-
MNSQGTATSGVWDSDRVFGFLVGTTPHTIAIAQSHNHTHEHARTAAPASTLVAALAQLARTFLRIDTTAMTVAAL